MSDIQNTGRVNHALTPKWRLLAAGPQSAQPTGGSIGADQLRLTQPTGGNAANGTAPTDPGQYAQFVADTIAMLDSTDPRQRFQAIVNMTKMQPNEAIPLLQRATQNDNAQVRELAQRALTVMQQMPGAPQGAATPGATPAAPAATPAAPNPQPGATTPPGQAPAVPGATPAAPAATPATTAPAAQAQAAAPAATSNRSFQDVLYDLQDPGVSEEAKIRAVLELEAHAGANRQHVVNALLHQIDPRQNSALMGSDQRLLAAIGVLSRLQAAEATPFFQACGSNYIFSKPVREAAQKAFEATQQQGGATAQNSTAGLQAAMYKLQHGSLAEKTQALLELEGLAGQHRQHVVNLLLSQIDPRQSAGLMGSNQHLITAISVLKRIGAPEATPFFQVISRMDMFDRSVRDAAKAAMQGGQNAAPPAQPAAQQNQGQQPPAAQPQNQQGGTIPGFLRR